MLHIGLTGGIGSGKSTVARIFEVLGIPVYYADGAARRLMQEDVALKQALTEVFGQELYAGEQLNRQLLAGMVFNNPAKLVQLNALVHPVTIADAAAWMVQQEAMHPAAPYTLKEAALIFESGSQRGLDYVIGVHAPKHLRLQRVMQRDGISREAVQERMSKQINETIKMRLCDFVITNDEQTPVLPQVLALHEQLKTLSRNA